MSQSWMAAMSQYSDAYDVLRLCIKAMTSFKRLLWCLNNNSYTPTKAPKVYSRGSGCRSTQHGSQTKLETNFMTSHAVKPERYKEAYLIQWKGFRPWFPAPLAVIPRFGEFASMILRYPHLLHCRLSNSMKLFNRRRDKAARYDIFSLHAPIYLRFFERSIVQGQESWRSSPVVYYCQLSLDHI